MKILLFPLARLREHFPVRVKRNMTVLDEAAAANKDREGKYGHPYDHFSRTIACINIRFAHKLKEPFSALDWPLIMEIEKICRGDDTDAKQDDDDVDTAGYANARGLAKDRMEEQQRLIASVA